MKLFYHYCSYGFSNCYILSSQASAGNHSEKNQSLHTVNHHNAAIIIDPGSMEKTTLDIIESNNMDIKAVLVTHDHVGHVHGLQTLKKIYNVEIFAVNQTVMNQKTSMVKDGDMINIGEFRIEVISIPGHSSDSIVYKIGNLLFTGDVLTAGLVGSTASAYGTTTQMNRLRSRLLSLPGDYTVLPGHGPPSTMEAERRFNASILNYETNRNKKPPFKIDLN